MGVATVQSAEVIDLGDMTVQQLPVPASANISMARVVKKASVTSCHPDNDLVDYVEAGEGFVVIDGNKHEVKAGDTVTIPRGAEFTWSAGVTLIATMNPPFEG